MKRFITGLIETARREANSTGSYLVVAAGGLSRWDRMQSDVKSELGSDCIEVRALIRLEFYLPGFFDTKLIELTARKMLPKDSPML